MLKNLTLAGAVALAGATPSFAANVDATAATDLNLRAGPGAWHEVLTVIPANATASVEGCLEEVEWCSVTYNGTSGWAYAPYLAVAVNEQATAISTKPAGYTIETVTYVDADATQAEQNGQAAAGATFGALIAYGLGGPIGGIIAGGIAGAAVGAASVEPTEETMTFVTANPVDTIYLDGEVVVGAGVPAEVVTYQTPQAELRYTSINNVPVLVDAETGVIVRVIG